MTDFNVSFSEKSRLTAGNDIFIFIVIIAKT